VVFNRVGQLHPVGPEELDPVVRRGVVRSADDRAGLAPVEVRQSRDGRGGDDAGQQRLAAGARDAGDQRLLERLAGGARVASDQDARAGVASAEDDRRRVAEARRQIDREVVAETAAHAVGAEVLAHPPAPWTAPGPERAGRLALGELRRLARLLQAVLAALFRAG